ncbi:hypothetical protein ACIQWL_50950 [Streptomyces mirabilis]|uniref:hypothetical protein n=1 Tax=Streptomyces mirabilis TaxID=68239 RepID=UPI0034017F4B
MSRRRTGALVAATATATAAALITSCSSGHDAAGKDPKTAPVADAGSNIDKSVWPKAVPNSGLAKDLSLPLQAYMQTYQDTVALDNAERNLETSCMAEYGFTVTFPPGRADPAAQRRRRQYAPPLRHHGPRNRSEVRIRPA